MCRICVKIEYYACVYKPWLTSQDLCLYHWADVRHKCVFMRIQACEYHTRVCVLLPHTHTHKLYSWPIPIYTQVYIHMHETARSWHKRTDSKHTNTNGLTGITIDTQKGTHDNIKSCPTILGRCLAPTKHTSIWAFERSLFDRSSRCFFPCLEPCGCTCVRMACWYVAKH
jgi:hypothetical protein